MAIHMALEANGHDAAAVFKAAGLSDAPSQDPLDRYTTVQMATLFREAVKSTGNPAFGLVAARFLHPSNVHALGYALLASATLRDACERLVYYFRIASNQGSYRIEESEGRFCLVLEVVADGVAFETIDAWNARSIVFVQLRRICRQLIEHGHCHGVESVGSVYPHYGDFFTRALYGEGFVLLGHLVFP
jgi:hypothetical protein